MRKLVLVALGAALIFGVSHIALAKAHVPVKKGQVCLNGRVLQVSEKAIDALVDRAGACELPACDFNNIFLKSDACSCELAEPRDSAEGVTPACPIGKF